MRLQRPDASRSNQNLTLASTIAIAMTPITPYRAMPPALTAVLSGELRALLRAKNSIQGPDCNRAGRRACVPAHEDAVSGAPPGTGTVPQRPHGGIRSTTHFLAPTQWCAESGAVRKTITAPLLQQRHGQVGGGGAGGFPVETEFGVDVGDVPLNRAL